MDGHRGIDLDREIESLFTVEPSPEFVARVRARVAEEPEPGGWRAPWMFAVAGTVTVAIVVALIAWPSSDMTPSNTVPAEPPQIAGSAQATPSSPVPVMPSARRPQAATRTVAIAVERDRSIDIDLPNVVIAENEVRTFASLVASIRQSRFDVAVPAAPDLDGPIEIKELPPIEPIEIEPIVKLATLQAEGERP